jgi:hypothetical protein
MNLASTLKNVLESVGKNNKPTYTVMAVATANGIFKPISSLTDKKEKPEARKYAALREFATECVAVPTYWACGVGAGTIGAKLFKNNPEKKAMAKANMMFLGVCTAALFVIPAVCSVALLVLDKFVKKDKRPQEPARVNVTAPVANPELHNTTDKNTKFGNFYTPSISSFANRGGLKI